MTTEPYPAALSVFRRGTAIDAIMTELGLNPAGAETDLATRLTPGSSGLTAAVSTVTSVDHGVGFFKRSVITAADLLITVANSSAISFGGVKLATFPAGVIQVLGCVLSTGMTIGFANAGNSTPVDTADGGDISFGSTITADSTLDGTMVDLIPKVSMDPLGTAVGGHLAALPALFDGHTTAATINLNMIVDDADVGDGASDILEVSFVLDIYWLNLGDY